VSPDVLAVDEGTPIGVDGETGLVWIRPSEEVVHHLGEQSRAYQERLQTARARAEEPAATADGTEIRVEANVSRLDDAATTGASGADGVGLLRTEFLFLDADDAPTEDEQVEVLTQIAERCGTGPITIRALDVGGDKPLRYLPLPPEDNPFLGLRGIRVLLRYPSLFKTQIRAILRVGARHTVRMLLPMVATPSEVRRTREMVEEVRRDLDEDGVEHADALPIGSMVETPASAVAAQTLAPHVDFFSIGTNDLTQYTMAADREHGDLGDLTSALQPPVLHLIRQTVDAAAEHDCSVSVCGEIAGDHDALPVLLGLGVRRLSVAPALVAEVKATIRDLRLTDCQSFAARALRADDARAVRTLAREFYE
jgi:phosphoenolpyruvate-protein phosphotransferase